MELSPMRYKDFTWPHNPRTYTIEFRRVMGNHKVPFGRYHLQDLGMSHRVLKGEGEFVGPEAYDQLKALGSLFYDGTPGMLVHPVWQMSNAYFVEFSLLQEPRPDYVSYAFTFWESYDGYEAKTRRAAAEAQEATGGGTAGQVWHKVVRGDTLWKISRDYGVELTTVIALNPQIKNPNLIYVGQEVRVK